VQERIVEILMYVLSEVQRTKKPLGEIDFSSLVQKGYTQDEIVTACSWLQDRLHSDTKIFSRPAGQQSDSFRILHNAEKYVISSDAYGYLIQLRQLNLISVNELEVIIDRAMLSGFEQLTVDEIKAIVASVILDVERNDVMRGRTMLDSSDTVN